MGDTKLEVMSFEACRLLHVTTQTPFKEEDPFEADFIQSQENAIADFIIIYDALVNREIEDPKNHPNIATLWAARGRENAKIYSDKYRSAKWLPKLQFLSLGHETLQAAHWRGARREIFGNNPNYHGSHYGPEYSLAVETGRLALVSETEVALQNAA
ncbi:hypothetical protein KY385_03665 [Candidatus Parcubacteria bacterium]|nr:hypothetical protein [Candidatus Parcubacteria bacterium]